MLYIICSSKNHLTIFVAFIFYEIKGIATKVYDEKDINNLVYDDKDAKTIHSGFFSPAVSLSEKLKGNEIIIIGEKMIKNILPKIIVKDYKKVTAFFRSFEDPIVADDVEIIVSKTGRGFASYVADDLDPKYQKIATIIDNYYYGIPTKDDLAFMKGLEEMGEDTDGIYENIKKIIQENIPIEIVVKTGYYESSILWEVAETNMKTSTNMNIAGKKENIRVVVTSHAIKETNLFMSEKYHRSMVIHYDLNKNKTFVHVRVSKEVFNEGFTAKKFMKEIIPLDEQCYKISDYTDSGWSHRFITPSELFRDWF